MQAAPANNNLTFFVPPGSHSCWVDVGEVSQALLHDSQWDPNPKPLDLGHLWTGKHAPIYQTTLHTEALAMLRFCLLGQYVKRIVSCHFSALETDCN